MLIDVALVSQSEQQGVIAAHQIGSNTDLINVEALGQIIVDGGQNIRFACCGVYAVLQGKLAIIVLFKKLYKICTTCVRRG